MTERMYLTDVGFNCNLVLFCLCSLVGSLSLHFHWVNMMVPNRGTFHKMSSEFSLTKLSAIVITRSVFLDQLSKNW